LVIPKVPLACRSSIQWTRSTDFRELIAQEYFHSGSVRYTLAESHGLRKFRSADWSIDFILVWLYKALIGGVEMGRLLLSLCPSTN
jgi:hypothetical protein